jgi:DNA-binding HxlR family transcriptional regulator
VGPSESVGYCSYTKAIEHLGDRWSLLIVRELGTFGPQGFNDLVTALPGRISRSVLADRLRRLETLGLVSRRASPVQHPAYRLTAVGQSLMATLGSLRAWADTWLPDDPDMLERDPDVVLGWLAERADPDRGPVRAVVLELRLHHRSDRSTGSC